MARPKLVRREKNILAHIHTGIETIVQIITSEVIAITMEGRSIIDFCVS
jgi:hypothetical protein